MIQIYEKVILWTDVILIATPIRWGSASSLYYKMIQRINCVQNQMIAHNRYLIRDKVAAFIITGGQDSVQHVAGELMSFWSQLGFVLGKFPFVRGLEVGMPKIQKIIMTHDFKLKGEYHYFKRR